MKLAGFRELEASLARLSKAAGKGVLRRVARGALEPMADAAAAHAPVDVGLLAFSISVSEKRTKRAKGKSARRLVGGKWRFDPTTSIDMAMGPAAGQGALNYATHVEFGTIDTAAKPYMRPAWDSGKMKALDYVTDNLANEIGKATARAERTARRRAAK